MPASLHKNGENPGCRLIVGGGGTGGHLFPGIAVAQDFAARHEGNRVLFINAGRPLETKVLTELDWPQHAIAIEGIKGRGRWRQAWAAMKIPNAVWQAGRAMKDFGVDVVLGVGGYAAGPVVMAAWLKGTPTALHEQNQLPGVTNRILGKIADRVFVTFADSQAYFKADKVQVTGNPVRREILYLSDLKPPHKSDNTFMVLIMGGSQGAHAINQAVMDALPLLKKHKGLSFVHQTGPQDETAMQQAFAQSGIQGLAQSFFNDMARSLQQADLIICRAGATTVAEITVAGKAAVFVPFPFATDDHQVRNAQALVNAGAAQMILQKDLNGEVLARTIVEYMQNQQRLDEMAAKARAMGQPDAARKIVDGLYALMEENCLAG